MRCDQIVQRLVLLHTNGALHSNVNVAGAVNNCCELVFQVTLLDQHQHLCYTRFCDHWYVDCGHIGGINFFFVFYFIVFYLFMYLFIFKGASSFLLVPVVVLS